MSEDGRGLKMLQGMVALVLGDMDDGFSPGELPEMPAGTHVDAGDEDGRTACGVVSSAGVFRSYDRARAAEGGALEVLGIGAPCAECMRILRELRDTDPAPSP